jgi:hypothetical protein
MIVPEVFQRSMPKPKKKKRKSLKKHVKVSLKEIYGPRSK